MHQSIVLLYLLSMFAGINISKHLSEKINIFHDICLAKETTLASSIRQKQIRTYMDTHLDFHFLQFDCQVSVKALSLISTFPIP